MALPQPLPAGPWRWLTGSVLIQDFGPRNAVIAPMRARESHDLRSFVCTNVDGRLVEIDPNGEFGRALALLPELVAFVKRVGYEPVGHSEATDHEILESLTVEARDLHTRILP